MKNEEQPSKVPARDRPEGEVPEHCYGAERKVWTDAMLITLHERRVRGNRWFSLIDKVVADRTLETAWSKVTANSGAAGVDGVNIAQFAKNSQARLLAVKEHVRKGDYQPRAVKLGPYPKSRKQKKTSAGHSNCARPSRARSP